MATVPYTQYTFANQTGNVALNQLDSNFSNIGNLVNNALVVLRPSQPNITSVGTLTTLNVTGDITSGGFVRGNGALLTGVVASNANALNLVGNTLSSTVVYSNLITVGTLSGLNVNGSISANGAVTASYFYGDGSHLTNLPITIGATGPAGSNGSPGATGPAGSNGSPGATGSFSGNLTTNLDGQGYSISNVSTISTTGNVTSSGYFIGSFSGNISGNLVVPGANTQVIYNNNGNAGASTALTFNSASNVLSVAGNISTSGNILTTGYVSATGSVSGSYFFGNGSALTGLPATYSNVNVANFLNNFGSNNISGTGNISINNIRSNGSASVVGNVSVGNLASTMSISAYGNITGGGLYVGASPVMTSNVARYTWVSNLPPGNSQGNIGDIWYQTY